MNIVEYDHPDDYTPRNIDWVEWIDTTILGSGYRTQMDARAKYYRYRKIGAFGPWLEGHPPGEEDDLSQH